MNGGLLTLTDGYIYSSANNMLVVNNGGNATGGSALSFVHGPMRKTGNQAFIFPTGEDVAPVGFGTEDVWARIGISNPTNTTTQFTAQYFYSYYGSMAKDVTLTHVSFHEYWILNRAINNDNVRVSLYYESATRSFITDYTSNDLVVARFNTSNLWTSEGQFFRSNSDPGFITSNTVTNFSPFTFGSITAQNTFPVEISSFSAIKFSNKVQLDWMTASEKNLNHFEIEKSLDGVQFNTIASQKATGNSQTNQIYQNFDYNPVEGVNYYRLKSVDEDGKFMYSSVVAVLFDNQSSVQFYPNPASTHLNISLLENQDFIVEIFDLSGKLVQSEKIYNSQATIISTDKLSKGTYFMRIGTSTQTTNHKLVIE